MSGLPPNWVRLVLNGTKLGLFKIQNEQKPDLYKSHIFFQLGPTWPTLCPNLASMSLVYLSTGYWHISNTSYHCDTPEHTPCTHTLYTPATDSTSGRPARWEWLKRLKKNNDLVPGQPGVIKGRFHTCCVWWMARIISSVLTTVFDHWFVGLLRVVLCLIKS